MPFFYAVYLNNNPIGIFDSGVGGLTIWKSIKDILPKEDFIYIADNKNVPYGGKSEDELKQITQSICNFLLSKKCKLIVVACNTATMNTIKSLRKAFNVPFVGIEPATKLAAKVSLIKRIGVLATKGTLESHFFKSKADIFQQNDISIFNQEGIGLAKAIEERDAEVINKLIKINLEKLIKNNIDTLVLGCTHYPLIIKEIRSFLPKEIEVIDPSMAVAKQVNNILTKFNLRKEINTSSYSTFFSSEKKDALEGYLKTNFFSNENTISFIEKLNLEDYGKMPRKD